VAALPPAAAATPTHASTPTFTLSATATVTLLATEAPTHTPTPTATETASTTPSNSPRPTSTSTWTPSLTVAPAPTFTLSGTVFFDYNGNGVRDAGEPPIPGASIRVGTHSATSAQDGTYSTRGIPAGNRQVRVLADGFRYLSLSLASFQRIDQPVNLAIRGNTWHDLGLMQGFLTLPFRCGTNLMQSIYVDLDATSGVRDWAGGSFTWDGHLGIDYDMPIGQTIVAPAPGTVIEAEGG
jgi:hypothetical protein